MTIVATDHLFESAHAALTFAFNFSDQAYDRPLMNRMAAPSRGSGKGLAGLDGAGQAGLVRYQVRTLGQLAEAVLIARFAPPTMPCQCRQPCCSGKRVSREWSEAIAFLADHVGDTALRGCVVNGAMRRDYVVRLFIPKIVRQSVEELAERHSIHRQSCSDHIRRVAEFFRGRSGNHGTHHPGIETLALQAIDQTLRDACLIP